MGGGGALLAVKTPTFRRPPEKKVVHGDPFGDAPGVPWFGSRLTKRIS